MKIKEYYLENKQKYGNTGAIKKTIQHGLQRIIGTDIYEVQLAKQKEELDTLFYFLDSFVDIESVKPATGDLRMLQECDVLLLAIIDKICEQNRIPYFIGWGTLLGAKRHKGFIPWDDDTDVCMLREDYNRALSILPDMFKTLGFDVQIDEKVPLASIGIGYKHLQTGIWVDIFPFDSYKWDMNCNSKKQLAERIVRYRQEYLMLREKNATLEEVLAKKHEIFTGLSDYESADCIFYNTEFEGAVKIFNKHDIFPLKKMQFETVFLNVPFNTEGVLNSMYGSDYMKFPHNGVEHHGNEKDRISNWAKMNGVNMNAIKNELIHILESIGEKG